MRTLSAAVRVFVLQTLIAFAMFFYRMFRQNHLIFSGKKTEALCAEKAWRLMPRNGKRKREDRR